MSCLNHCTALILPHAVILVQNRLDTNDGVKDVWSRISLKRGEPVNIEDVILACLVGEVAVLDGCKRDHLRGLLCLFLTDLKVLFCLLVLRDLFEHFLIHTLKQILQAHNAALTGLKRLAVLAVHRTEAEEL